jgi:hypothetical protein
MLGFMSRWPSAQYRFGAIAFALALSTMGAVRADTLPPGTIVVARSAPAALLVWDASAAVGDLVVARRSGDDGMRALESDGVTIMAARAPRLRAKSVELRIQYSATGVAGAAYQASTFANATQLLVLTAPRALIAARAHAWQAAIASHRAPDGLGVRVVGAFPQPQ